MVNTVHVSAAAAIVALAPNPLISLPLALASHLILDTVPHWNWSPGRSLAGKLASVNDGLVAIIVLILLANYMDRSWVVIVAGFLSMVPDIIQAPYHFWGWKPAWLESFIGWERRRQKWPWMPKWVGIVTQVVVFVTSLFIILTI